MLALATLVLSFVVCLAIAWTVPTPPPVRMTLGEVLRVVRGGTDDALTRAIRASPPAGRRVEAIEAALARALSVDPATVRARWRDSEGAGKASDVGQSVVLVGDRALLVDSGASGFQMRYGPDVRIGLDVRMPAFDVALRQHDGRWQWVMPVDRHRREWRMRLLIAFGIALVLSAAPVWLASRRLSRPIMALASRASVSALETEASFPLDGPEEIRAVARAMNDMHRRLAEQAAERFQSFTAIAHDLRTPLTGLRIRAECMPPGERERMVADLERMGAMIDDMLAYARIDRQGVRWERVDLVAFLRAITLDRQSIAQPVDFRPSVSSASAQVDPLMLRRAIDNLLDNAFRYAGNASLDIARSGSAIHIHVDDTGPGIPENHMEAALKPFTRLEASRNAATGGVGLGLAIAERVCTAHGGRLHLQNRSPQGLRVTIVLNPLDDSLHAHMPKA